MELTEKELLDLFCKENPDLDKREVSNVVSAIWRQVRDTIDRDTLRRIRIKYFGVFLVKDYVVKGLKKSTENKNKKKHEKKYDDIIYVCNKYLKKLKKEEDEERASSS